MVILTQNNVIKQSLAFLLNSEMYDVETVLGMWLIFSGYYVIFLQQTKTSRHNAYRGTARQGTPAKRKMITLIHEGYSTDARDGNSFCKPQNSIISAFGMQWLSKIW